MPEETTHNAAYSRYECPAAPLHWSAEWLPSVMGAVPNFCPWCGERIEAHNNYLVTLTTGVSEADVAAVTTLYDPSTAADAA